MSRPAVFLDRDGVLVEEIYYPAFGETEAPMRAQDVRLLPGVIEATARLRDMGFLLIVVTNQGAAAKGKTDLRALWLAHRRFTELMAEGGVALDGEFLSFTHPNGIVPGLSGPSLDRKPSPYPILVSAAQHDVDLERSWMVGDRATDIACGRDAGVTTVRIAPRPQPGDGSHHHAASLTDAVTIIAQHALTPA